MAESANKKTATKGERNLPDQVLDQIEARHRAAIQGLRRLVDRLDNATPDLVDDPSARKKVIDAIGDYYEQLAATTNEYLRSVVRGASEVASNPASAKDLYGFLRSFVSSGSEPTLKEDNAKRAD